MRRSTLTGLGLVLLAASAATAAEESARVPVTIQEYEASRGPDSRTVAPQVVRMHNITRVMDNDLPAADRIASLRLAHKLGPDDRTLASAVGAVAADPRTPAELQNAILEIMPNSRPVAGAVPLLSATPPGSPLRKSYLEVLLQRGEASSLADVVKAWAQEPLNGRDEQLYRKVGEKLSGVAWDTGLLNAINAPSFFARGSAMNVLAGRLTASAITAKLGAITARTEAMAALKASVTQLGYVPDGGPSLLAVVSVHQVQPNSFSDVARLSRQWKTDSGYDFNIRDFHLLSRLTGDPLRNPTAGAAAGATLSVNTKRDALVASISVALNARQHIPRAGSAEGSDSFAKNGSSLTMADLWNIYLFNQMLVRPRVLLALRVMAEKDRADTRTAWGGLIVYESGGAEARLYPPDKDAPADDLKYVPSRQMITEGRDAMARFQAHFEKASNGPRAGPTAEELRDARDGNFYGLVFTSLSDAEFCVHYYNPQGTVISLGRMAFKY